MNHDSDQLLELRWKDLQVREFLDELQEKAFLHLDFDRADKPIMSWEGLNKTCKARLSCSKQRPSQVPDIIFSDNNYQPSMQVPMSF